MLSFIFTAKICGEDGMVDPNCFVIAQSVVFAILEQQWVPNCSFSKGLKPHLARCPQLHVDSRVTGVLCVISAPWHPQQLLYSSSTCPFISRHFIEFLRSHHFCKYQIEVLTSGSVFLADILFCESALFYFSEVSGLAGSQSMVLFVMHHKQVSTHITTNLLLLLSLTAYHQRGFVYLFCREILLSQQ